jgi:hypothetical protein
MLARCGDAQYFTQAAAELALPRRHRRTMGRQARAYALALDWHQIVDRFAAILMSAGKPELPEDKELAARLAGASPIAP